MKVCSLLAMAAMTAAVVAAPVTAQEWLPLQDGKSLAGWKAAERPESWKVEDGAFVSVGDRSHLFYVGKVGPRGKPGNFKNFEFSAEVMTSPGANSGIYVHTKWQGPGWPTAGYELQVINSNPPAETTNGYIEHKMTGSIYAIRNTWVAPAKDNEWFNYRIKVVGKTIQTFINDKLICEYAEPADAFRPDDKKQRLLGSGTFALQAHDPGSVVKYRNMKVKILPDDAQPPAAVVPIMDSEMDRLVTQASNDNIPLIDLAQPPVRGDAETFWSSVRRHGMTWGNELPAASVASVPQSVVVIVDANAPPNVELLKAAKAAGAKVVFSAGASEGLGQQRLKARLQAIKDAGLGWKDFWVPGKN
jgi:hypothetical protein